MYHASRLLVSRSARLSFCMGFFVTMAGCASSSGYSTRYTSGLGFQGGGQGLITGSVTPRESKRATDRTDQAQSERFPTPPHDVMSAEDAVEDPRYYSQHELQPQLKRKAKLAAPPRQVNRPGPNKLAAKTPVTPKNFGPTTYDPLPYYAGPDKNRARYKWNGSHKRVSIDNRPKNQRTRSQVFVGRNGQRSVVVAPGDTLFGIASANGLTTGQVMSFNNMKRSEVRAGQVLFLPTVSARR